MLSRAACPVLCTYLAYQNFPQTETKPHAFFATRHLPHMLSNAAVAKGMWLCLR